MPWIILVISAILEAVWATALGASNGLTVLGPSILFLIATTLSMVGLGQATKTIPIGTAYAVWTGLGAALTALYAFVTGAEPLSPLKVLFLAGIVGAAIGLKVFSSDNEEAQPSSQ